MDARVTLATMLARSVLLSALAALGCSSSQFQVSINEDSASADPDTSTTTTDGEVDSGIVVEDAPVEAPPPGPCDPEDGKTKYCIGVKTLGVHPAYGTGDAAELGIDGKGKLYVLLYDKSPGPGVMPIKTIVYPTGDTMLNVDEGFPAKIVGTLDTPGEFFAVAFFADSDKMRGTGSDGVLPGDFVTMPKLSGMEYVYPKLSFVQGKVASSTLEIRPLRRLTVTFTAKTTLKSYGPSVHGDGPVMFGLTDAMDINMSTGWLHLETRGCVDLEVDSTTSVPGQVSFPVAVEGKHNAFAVVFDYSTNKPEFPGQGSLISPQSGSLPSVTIDPAKWTSFGSVEMTSLAIGPVMVGTPDPLTCP